MKKFTRPFLGIMTVFLLVLTAACSGSDDSESTNGGGNNDIIVGKWKYIGWYDAFLGEFEDDQDDCYDEIITFRSNGTGQFLEEDCEEGDYTSSFAWEKTAENVYEVSGEDASGTLNLSFEGNNRMTILEDEEGSGDVYVRQ